MKGERKNSHDRVPSQATLDGLLRLWSTDPSRDCADVLFLRLRPYLAAYLLGAYPQERDTVEDAVQTTLLKLWTILRREGTAKHIRTTYVAVMAKHSLLDEIRKRRSSTPFDEPSFAVEITGVPQLSEDHRLLIIDSMFRLNARSRFVLERYYFLGERPENLCRVLGVQLDSFYVILSRARASLKKSVALTLSPHATASPSLSE